MSTLTEGLNELSRSLSTQPPSITSENHININEAHAWDYTHIRELADKVADVLLPSLLRALGGGNNSY